jgi:hypothetical protein
MGSELVDTETDRQVWGLSDPRWYVSAWSTGHSLKNLALSSSERDGLYGRIRATRLLRFPAFAPILAGFEPYSKLIAGIRAVTVDNAAVAEFPYDWRLPVSYNARVLADFCEQHLATWRQRWAGIRGAEPVANRDGIPRLGLVAHSMGGLLAREIAGMPGLAEEIRIVITLGTPFYGAPKAIHMLSSGKGLALPLPHARVRALARALPGVYDLLPTYRCLLDRSVDAPHVDVARKLTPKDVAGMGADREQAERAFAWQAASGPAIPGDLVQVVGCEQPTIQSVSFLDGKMRMHRFTLEPGGAGEQGVTRVDKMGDSTVPRVSAQVPARRGMPLAQTHGAIAASNETVLVVQDALTDQQTGPWQGAGELGLDMPDTVDSLSPFEVKVLGASNAGHVACRVVDLESRLQVDAPSIRLKDGQLTATVGPLLPGLYRVIADGMSSSPVSQIVLSSAESAQP